MYSSDEFIQAQPLVRSASEELVGGASSSGLCAQSGAVGGATQREYFPSPLDSGESSPETEPEVRDPPSPEELTSRPPVPDNASSQDTLDSSPTTEQSALLRPNRYPEYKH